MCTAAGIRIERRLNGAHWFHARPVRSRSERKHGLHHSMYVESKACAIGCTRGFRHVVERRLDPGTDNPPGHVVVEYVSA